MCGNPTLLNLLKKILRKDNSLLIVLIRPFINKPDSSKDLIILMIWFISSLEIINVVYQNQTFFYE